MSLSTIAGACADVLFAAKRRLVGPHRSRRTRLYCVGMGKSGTHSIAAMFSEKVRSEHEPQARELLERAPWQPGRLGDPELREWLHKRDREMALEVDSSALNFDILDFLLTEFEEARFVLTIRDCYSWCNSLLNHMVRFASEMDPLWHPWLDSRCRPDLFRHEPGEQLLKEKGLYTLDGYLSYWARHNQEVLSKVSAERLFAVRTDQIHANAHAIAKFAGLSARSICLDRTHEYQNPTKQQLIRELDRDFLEAKVDRHCRPLMTRFFPEIKSLDDAKL
jgi:sulfotransferase family protein